MTDDARMILARRARLIAAALAGAGIGSCGGAQSNQPRACLESPGPSTEVVVPEPRSEASEDAGAPPPRETNDAGAALPPEDTNTRPRICLSEM